MKLGIIVDSTSGLSEMEARAKGWGYLPLHIFLDGKDYAEGTEITAEEVYEILTVDTETRSSCSSPSDVLKEFKKMSKKYDHIIVYPLSTKLSGQYSSLHMLSKEFKNIHVFESHSMSLQATKGAEYALKLAKQGKSIEQIMEALEKTKNDALAIVVPSTLDWLVKGGRVKPNVAAMAKMLKIIPMIKFYDGELTKHGKGRTFNKTIIKGTKDVMEHFKNQEYDLIILHTSHPDLDKHVAVIEETTGKEANVLSLPTVITMHVGLGAIIVAGLKVQK